MHAPCTNAPRLGRRRLRESLVVASLILARLHTAHAMMQETVQGKTVQVFGHKVGYERHSAFWSDLGEFNSSHLYLGPVELIHGEAKDSPARFRTPAQLGVRVGTWSTVAVLDSKKQTGFWICLALMAALVLGMLRKRRAECQRPAEDSKSKTA